MGAELLRSAVVTGCLNNADLGYQLEFEGVEAKGQSLSDGLQRRFLECPELEKSPVARQTTRSFNSLGLGYRKELLSELGSLQVPLLIFDVDTDPMRRRPRPTKPIRQDEKLNQWSGKSVR